MFYREWEMIMMNSFASFYFHDSGCELLLSKTMLRCCGLYLNRATYRGSWFWFESSGGSPRSCGSLSAHLAPVAETGLRTELAFYYLAFSIAMASRKWFVSQLEALGLGGLEGVYGYLESMPLDEVDSYLESLTGPSPSAVSFRKAYLAGRSEKSGGSSSVAQTPSSYADTPARDLSDSNRGRRSGKKRGRGGGRGASSAKPSFATKAAPAPTRTHQQKAEATSAVERSRAKVREYRESRKVINCLSCGFIETELGEDGACSFCQAPMFPIEGEISASHVELNGVGRRDANNLREEEEKAVAQKSKLLAFDRSSTRRTTVHDDDSEYFDADSNNWLSAEERAAAFAKRDAELEARNRRSFSVTFDIAGKRVLTDRDPQLDGEGSESGSAAVHQPFASDRSFERREYANGDNGHERDAQMATTSPGSTGEFVNPLLPGPGPKFALREGAEGAKWLAAVLKASGPPVTGVVQREEFAQ